MVKTSTDHGKFFAGIVVHIMAKSCDQNIAAEILLGLEEEQVPYELATVEQEPDAANALETAYRASLKSVFGVGIGIAPDRVILHCSRLSIDNPVLTMPVNAANSKNYRTLGTNAARFIKGRPFDKIDLNVTV